ncbi:Fibronectin type III, partial [Trinorchestia longiramus]
GQQVQADDRVLVSGDHLVLQKVHRRWSGNFACSASNAIGEATSNSLEIAIQYAPVCGRTRPIHYRAALGQHVTLQCAVLANPTNVTFQWAFTNAFPQTLPSPGYSLASNSLITTSLPPPGITGGVRSAVGLEGRLKYQLQRVQDYGSVECRATNSVGPQAVPCVFTVRPPGIPSSKFQCKVTKQTWASVEIACSETSLNAPDAAENATDQTQVTTKLLQQLQMKHAQGSPKNSIQSKGPSKDKWSTTLEKDALGVKIWNGKDLRERLQNGDESLQKPELRADELQQLGEGEQPEVSSDTTAYMLTVRERLSNTLMHNTTGVQGLFNLTGLTPGADYVIRVWRVNRRGRSAPLTLETFTLRTAENRMSMIHCHLHVSSVSTSNNSTLSKGAEIQTDTVAVACRQLPFTGQQSFGGEASEIDSAYVFSPTVFSSSTPGQESSPAASDEVPPGDSGDCLRELERQRGVGVPGRPGVMRTADYRAQYVRSHQLTQVAQERESFL